MTSDRINATNKAPTPIVLLRYATKEDMLRASHKDRATIRLSNVRTHPEPQMFVAHRKKYGVSFFASWCLLLSLIMNPVLVVYADDEVSTEDDSSEEIVISDSAPVETLVDDSSENAVSSEVELIEVVEDSSEEAESSDVQQGEIPVDLKESVSLADDHEEDIIEDFSATDAPDNSTENNTDEPSLADTTDAPDNSTENNTDMPSLTDTIIEGEKETHQDDTTQTSSEEEGASEDIATVSDESSSDTDDGVVSEDQGDIVATDDRGDSEEDEVFEEGDRDDGTEISSMEDQEQEREEPEESESEESEVIETPSETGTTDEGIDITDIPEIDDQSESTDISGTDDVEEEVNDSHGAVSGESDMKEEEQSSDDKDISETAVLDSESVEIVDIPKDELISEEEVVTPAVNIAINPQNKYVFGDHECTLVNENEFYCIRALKENSQEEGNFMKKADGTTDRVFVKTDSDGDKEIFFIDKDGNSIQITNNTYDDTAPYYDRSTDMIVWQALIRDRNQIMLYDQSSGVTTQLTHEQFNNTNPEMYNGTVVWQGWPLDNWEIFRADMSLGQDIVIEQMTNNAHHDMFPHIQQQFITWQSFSGTEWTVMLFDRTTGALSEVESDGNGRYENPRLVLLLENRQDNGDVKTIGYDMATGELIPLGTSSKQSAPQPVPSSPAPNDDGAIPPPAVSLKQNTEQEDSGE